MSTPTNPATVETDLNQNDVEQNTPLIAYKEPLSPMAKRCLLAVVIFFHVGGGWALTQFEPAKLIAPITQLNTIGISMSDGMFLV